MTDIGPDVVGLPKVVPPLDNVLKVQIVIIGGTVSFYKNEIGVTVFDIFFGIAVPIIERLTSILGVGARFVVILPA